MKKILAICSITALLWACNPNNDHNGPAPRDTTDHGNAGMSGTMNANGLLPVDSNKSIHGQQIQSQSPDTLQDSLSSRDSIQE